MTKKTTKLPARRRVKLGDIFEIPTKKGIAYAQYIGKHLAPPRYGALIRVFEPLYQKQLVDPAIVTDSPERFLTFFPLGAVVYRGIFQVVGNAPVPEKYSRIPLLRAPLRYIGGLTGRVRTWIFWDGQDRFTRESTDLTADERRTSLKQCITDVVLVEHIENDWRPEDKIESSW